ncbi:transcriptional regulator, AraC family [Necator americanus]|uniref:Transcriptional regulator, AraC family n=1 Tax=Necator americanus TaxID=51031 RepID=W2TN71_NECAM|nr:transcriptional regulator, AraC family [Necator americanus]ETN83550.1 transcriptional regulator, AraC family [Necator americanus]
MVTRANIPLYGLLTAARTARGAALVRIASSPQTLARMHANRETDDRFWLALHQAGHAEFHDGTRSFELSPGDIVFGPAHHTFDLTFHSDFRQFQISLPGAAVQARLPCARSLSPAHLSGQAGLGRLLAGTLTGLADTFDTLNDEQVASVESSLFDYLASSLNASADDAAAAAGKHQAAALYRVCQFIENTLSDSTLSLTMVASSQNMSERLVQKLFDGTGQTFTGYLRQRRLERCCSDLANRQYGHLSISDICFRWGFNDAAHFSHAFRDRYGLSPRQYRRQTTEASEQKLRKRIQRVYNFRWTTQRDPQGVEHRTIDYPGVPVERDSIVENHGVLEGVTIPVRPHFGVVALAPAETGLVDSVPPSHFGGNIDNWRVTKGATLYLRVAAVGGLLSVGDPHASQGDGELCGTAIECSFTGVFQVILHKAESLTSEPFADIDYPLIETPDEWVLQGFSHPNYLKELGERAPSLVYERSSLDSAMRDAFRKTRRFLMTAFSLSEDEAISLISVAVDFSVTQVVNGNWGVHAVIRKSMFTQRLNRLNAAHSQGGATTS